MHGLNEKTKLIFPHSVIHDDEYVYKKLLNMSFEEADYMYNDYHTFPYHEDREFYTSIVVDYDDNFKIIRTNNGHYFYLSRNEKTWTEVICVAVLHAINQEEVKNINLSTIFNDIFLLTHTRLDDGSYEYSWYRKMEDVI